MKRQAVVLLFAVLSCRDASNNSLHPVDAGRGNGNVDEQGITLDAGNGHLRRDTGVVSGPCGAATLCSDCIYKLGCGWCPSSNSCINGDQHGPLEGSCPGFSIQEGVCGASGADAGAGTDAGDQAAACSATSDCASCTATPNCGFCADTNICAIGSFEGPATGACREWEYFSSQCTGSGGPAEVCSGAYDCASCSAQSGCGWCDSTNSCVPGSFSGPDRGQCFRWVGDSHQCTTCGSAWSCEDCTYAHGCGWCDEKQDCEPGSWNGPSVGYCSSWITDSNSCFTNNNPGWPTGQGCSSVSTCADCASTSGCGWCDSASACMDGNSSGPLYGACSAWAYSASACNNPSPPSAPSTSNCTTFSCEDCASRSGCGWCNDTASCGDGNASGPWSGSCSAWIYTPSSCAGSGPPDAGTNDSGASTSPSGCGEYTECGDCTVHAGCGYCNGTNSCESGSAGGPASGSCGEWAWLSTECASTPTAPNDPCASSTRCGDCTTRAGCGFCNSDNACESGSSNGPDNGSCSDWAWYSSSCTTSSDPCATNATCGGCVAASSCGFCLDTDDCVSGSASGPSNGSCSDWAWNSSDCSAPPDPCASNATCSACTAANGCGYCLDGFGDCESGSASGPTSGSCSDWAWLSSECMSSPPPDPCASYGTCSGCTGASGCGYCWDTFDCESGSSGGPSSGSCSDWAWYSSDCSTTPPPPPPDPCGNEFTCVDCTYLNGCGWCEDSYSCMSGDAAGPTSGGCFTWDYYSSICP